MLVERDNITLFGAGDALTNDQVVRGDNAAVTLRLLGQTDRLLWFVPSYDDLSAGDGVSAETLLPRWIRPGLWLAAIIALVVIAWRVRRLGPLAIEPLPGRGEGDRDHPQPRPPLPQGRRPGARRGRTPRGDPHPRGRAASAGRRHGTFAGEAALIRDVARHVGRSEAEIAAILGSRRTDARLRQGPDIPGHGPGHTRGRGTPQMTETPHRARVGPAPTRARASGWPPYAPRSRRPWSARTPRCPACWSRCCAAATC